MKLELKRVDPLRTANIGALVYGLLMAVFAIIFLPFFLLGILFVPSAGPESFFVIFILVLYPIIGAVMGWISGLLTAAIYNLVIRWSGGLLLDFDSVT